MNEIDFDAINSAAMSCCPSLLETILPGGRVHGKEYVAASVRGGDGSSFKFNLESGLWSDFATPEQSGGGLISLVAEARGISRVEAARELAELTGTPLPQASPKSTVNRKKEKPVAIAPVPKNAPPPPEKHYRRGKPDAVYEYKNQEGRLLQCVCRFNKNEVSDNSKPKKEFRPLVWTSQGWEWQALPAPLPFYGLERLALAPSDAPILVLEGEGKADAVHGLIGKDMAVLSMNGGSSGVGKNDFSPLKGRHVLYWPDNDEPGEKAARVFLQKARDAGAASVFLVPIPEGKPEAWDAGDAVKEGWGKDELLEHICIARDVTDEPNATTDEAQLADDDDSEDSEKPLLFPATLTENGLAVAFAYAFKEDLRFNHNLGDWSIFNGNTWDKDNTRRVPDEIRKFIARANVEYRPSFGKASTVAGVEKLVAAMEPIAATSELFDQDDLLLGCPGGVLELSTGLFRPGHREDFITMVTGANPTDEEDCPRWKQFISECAKGDAEYITFAQRVVGYCLAGRNPEHALFVLWGPGKNGKSVFLNILKAVLGGYATTASFEVFAATRSEQHPTALAALVGKRLVTASEVEEGQAFAEARIKQMTGGDPITARFMRQDFFTYQPRFTPLIAANNKPALRNVDDAIRRRVKMLPFTNQPANPDIELESKLRRELPGILRWAVNGFLAWQREGLAPPAVVESCTSDYFESEDVLGQWIETCCSTGSEHEASAAALYASWRGFREARGEKPGTQKTFSARLASRGLTKKKRATGWFYQGLSPKVTDCDVTSLLSPRIENHPYKENIHINYNRENPSQSVIRHKPQAEGGNGSPFGGNTLPGKAVV